MANRNYNRLQALTKESKVLYASISIGAAGAPTLTNVSTNSVGIASVSRTSAGLYVITLQDTYTSLLAASVSIQAAAAENLTAQLAAQDVSGAKTVTIRTQASGVATDPTSGDTLRVRLDLKNSSI